LKLILGIGDPLIGRLMLSVLYGIDIVVRRAWYESLRSVTLSMHREFLAPLVRDELELAHQAGALYMYICTADTMGLIPTWLESGIDIVWGIDPVQGDADLARLLAVPGDKDLPGSRLEFTI